MDKAITSAPHRQNFTVVVPRKMTAMTVHRREPELTRLAISQMGRSDEPNHDRLPQRGLDGTAMGKEKKR